MEKDNFFDRFAGQIIKGVIVGVAITLAGTLIFALLISIASISDAAIKPINQFVKLLAIFGGCALSVKGEKGYLKGAIIGGLITVASYLLFGLIAGALSSFVSLIIDLACGIIMGLISGAISVNIPRRA